MKKNIAIKDYCRNEEIELSIWKSKLSNAIRKMDMAKTGNTEKIYEEINDLHILLDILMGDLEDRVGSLCTSGPAYRRKHR